MGKILVLLPDIVVAGSEMCGTINYIDTKYY
jgi:hypothetical protein